MSKTLAELQVERGRLQERIASQRAALTVQLVPLQRASDTAHRALDLVQRAKVYLREHPTPVVGALLALALLRPRGTWRLVFRASALWRSWRMVRSLVPASLWGFWRW